jgi:hypothetical protein
MDFDYRNLLPTRSSSVSDEPSTDDDSDGCCGYFPDLTWRERLIGCGTCMIAGYLLSFGSFWRLGSMLTTGNPIPFVVNATVGNVLALAGSCFLSGPKTQYEKMWHDSRRVATAMYLGSLFLTLVVAFTIESAVLLIVLMICQSCAITWYCLSYVPWARDMMVSYARRRLSTIEM